MIHIDRNPNPPEIKVYLANTAKAIGGGKKVTKAEQERAKAIAFFTSPKNYKNDEKVTKKNFSFNIYKDKELIEQLEAIFYGKCAYCESRFAHVTPQDIEHFRPKSEIDTGSKKVKPGYYWLAGDWNNLLISCPDCNRSRKHSVPGQSKKVKLGKSTQFPLDDETKRVRNHDVGLATEETARLLLNPCEDKPEEHLTFDEKGLVNPHLIGGQESNQGRASIDVYALQRKGLVEERLKIIDDFRFQIEQLHYLVKIHNEFIAEGKPADKLDENLAQIKKVVDKIVSMLDRKAPYLGMLREWILRAKAAGEFVDLIQFGIDPSILVPTN